MSLVGQFKHNGSTYLTIAVKTGLEESILALLPAEHRLEEPGPETTEPAAAASSSDPSSRAVLGVCICGCMCEPRKFPWSDRVQRGLYVCDSCWATMPLFDQMSMVDEIMKPVNEEPSSPVGSGDAPLPRPNSGSTRVAGKRSNKGNKIGTPSKKKR